MSETEWGADAPEPPKKKGGVPKWVWIGCGVGCLVAVVIAILIAVGGFMMVDRLTDPEYAKEQLAELVPYDEWPEGYDARGGGAFGMEQYFIDASGSGAMLIVMRLPNRIALDNMFDPESRDNQGVFGVGKISNAEEGTIELQGREVRCLRFHAWIPDDEVEGPSLRVDLTGEGSVPVLVQVMIPNGPESLPDEVVTDLLEPFDVWRGK